MLTVTRNPGTVRRTWTEKLYHSVNVLRFNAVDDVVADTGYEVTGFKNFNIWLDKLSTNLLIYDIHDGCPTLLRNSSTKESNFSGMSQAFTLSWKLARTLYVPMSCSYEAPGQLSLKKAYCKLERRLKDIRGVKVR